MILQASTPAPAYIPDSVPTGTVQQNLATNQVGVLDISSVYDFDGIDTAKPNIASQANPSQDSQSSQTNAQTKGSAMKALSR